MKVMIAAIIALVAVTAVASVPDTTVAWTETNGAKATGTLRVSGNGWAPCDSNVVQASGWFDIDATTNKHYFFWAFESRNSPATDPVILWETGGPGCSSGLAVLYENGPCKIDLNGNLHNNPYSWNNNATVIYIDQPAGVGYSWADAAGYDSNETQVGEDMYRFMQALYQAYPKFLSNDFFVSAESYGGHYGPATANRILRGNQMNEGLHINLKGLQVGNGLTQPSIQYKYYAELAYNWCATVKGEPCISKAEYEEQVAAIPGCIAQINQCQTNNDTACINAQDSCGNSQMGPYFNTNLNPYDIRIPCEVPGLCYNLSASVVFFNRADVQAALGVASQNISWQMCSDVVNSMFSADWMHNFDQDVQNLLNSNIRVLIYAGDMDFICNWIGNKAWTLALPWANHTAFAAAADEPWYLDEVEAGFVRTVSSKANRLQFSFVQVHGSGHMVPMDQPARALRMANNFIFDKPFK